MTDRKRRFGDLMLREVLLSPFLSNTSRLFKAFDKKETAEIPFGFFFSSHRVNDRFSVADRRAFFVRDFFKNSSH